MTDYDGFADAFIAARSRNVGVATVRDWALGLPAGARVLDLGCGHGIPIGRTLAEAGFSVHGVDASPRLLAAFRENVPGATTECANAATLDVKPGSFDGVVAVGLLFLLPPSEQEAVIHRAAIALGSGGRMLMTAPWQVAEWTDALTGLPSESLGRARYEALFEAAGLLVTGEADDEGGNHYWFAMRV